MSASALHFTAADLAGAEHTSELQKRKEIVVCLDAVQLGLGGASCGPRPMSKYILYSTPIVFSYSLRPYVKTMGDLAEAAVMRLPIVSPVSVERDQAGLVRLDCDTEDARITYQIDSGKSMVYQGPFPLNSGGVVMAKATLDDAIPGPTSVRRFNLLVSRSQWRIVRADSEHPGEGEAVNAIDGKPETYWHTKWGGAATRHPHEIELDLGQILQLKGITYLPRQGSDHGRIGRYELYVSRDGQEWGLAVATGRLKNVAEQQVINLPKITSARYVRLVALSEVKGNIWTSIAELGVVAVGKEKK